MLLLIGFQIYIGRWYYTYLATATVPNESNMYCLIRQLLSKQMFGYTYNFSSTPEQGIKKEKFELFQNPFLEVSNGIPLHWTY